MARKASVHSIHYLYIRYSITLFTAIIGLPRASFSRTLRLEQLRNRRHRQPESIQRQTLESVTHIEVFLFPAALVAKVDDDRDRTRSRSYRVSAAQRIQRKKFLPLRRAIAADRQVLVQSSRQIRAARKPARDFRPHILQMRHVGRQRLEPAHDPFLPGQEKRRGGLRAHIVSRLPPEILVARAGDCWKSFSADDAGRKLRPEAARVEMCGSFRRNAFLVPLRRLLERSLRRRRRLQQRFDKHFAVCGEQSPDFAFLQGPLRRLASILHHGCTHRIVRKLAACSRSRFCSGRILNPIRSSFSLRAMDIKGSSGNIS